MTPKRPGDMRTRGFAVVRFGEPVLSWCTAAIEHATAVAKGLHMKDLLKGPMMSTHAIKVAIFKLRGTLRAAWGCCRCGETLSMDQSECTSCGHEMCDRCGKS